jgi:hypothetical protein
MGPFVKCDKYHNEAIAPVLRAGAKCDLNHISGATNTLG